MFIQGIEKRGHTYYAVYHGQRLINKVKRETKLYIGNLENLDEPRRIDIEKQLKELGEPSLIQKFHSILLSRGYRLPSPISTFEIEEIYSYGQELALHKVCEEIELVNTINRFSPKGGGPELGKIVEIMAIARNCDPCSYYQLPDWFSRTALQFFLKVSKDKFTYDVALTALDYLQPKNTIPMQAKLYENMRRAYGYECERLDIDLTSTYFEGHECVLAEFGHPRGHSSDKRQIVIAFVVDQKGILVTHRVWPGNRTDVKSLKPVDRCLKNDFGLDAPRVVDRGIASWENIKYMERKKERYLVALRAEVKGTKLLNEIKKPRDEWTKVGDDEVAISVIRGKRKYVVLWNASVADTNKKERLSKVSKAEEELNKVMISVEKGKITEKSMRDEKIGYIKRKYGVTKYIKTPDKVNGLNFTIERLKKLDEVEQYDGYQVFVTTEFDLSEIEIVESYRVRDQIEKAIRTLKSVLGLHPQNVRTKEHILGNIFICATALQLRSILRLKLKERGIDTSIEDAMRMLERLKAVHIAIGKDDEIQVYRKLRNIDGELRKLVDVFKLSDNEKFPEVD
ncbi:MAG: IS1634 family transposase [ANME-2 cluster archaeon]|jgi:transposase|nr:MAG: IS1634 family transposase [ANME-2 cluster archaeon]